MTAVTWRLGKECLQMLKNRERIGTSLPKELVKELKEYSNKTMIPISKIIEEALKQYLAKNKSS